ncbi:RNA polymerase sigma-70 factor, ECF subfamily [Pedobacter steynii]|uniref:RNA polymerase sigma-70 factor, ECF subfamily n=1 Tax=Pedobacter steynii TaxID=430522 RepID=A0A1G9UCX7_9SPHI|nr:RNA polymerase sigma-70 factor [Pedobacter steynii]NQX40733.1 RNA polymerase sigma-70 factor [Pedobacter steynii]SDM57769.1 RNA polymerase sigma-70 factor, ECF subfamily [Pedobacter steynii]
MKTNAYYSSLNDSNLLECLLKGDELAFAEIYSRYKTVLFLHARRMLQDDEQARDVVQEIFTAIWIKKEELRVSTSLKSYLFSSVKHKILNLLLHQKHVEKHMQAMLGLYNAGSFVTDLAVQEKEMARLIEAEIQNLPARMREVFILSRREELSNKEIAQRMGIAEETVKKQIVYALKILRVKLKVVSFLLILWNQS